MIQIMETFLCPKWIYFNYSEEEKLAAKLYFFEKCGIPGIIGCVDGTHIRIIRPKEDIQHLYYNRKGFHSINAMIVSIKRLSLVSYFIIFYLLNFVVQNKNCDLIVRVSTLNNLN